MVAWDWEAIFRSYRLAGYSAAEFFVETPRSTLLALQAASEKAASVMRNTITLAWLNGRLSGMADPKTYPTLEAMLGEETAKPETEQEPDDKHVGAQLWIMFLNRGRVHAD